MGFGVYDCASSILLCAEDNSCILGFDEEDGGGCVEGGVENMDSGFPKETQDDGFFLGHEDIFKGFPPQSDECLALLVARESHHLPRDDYSMRLQTCALDISVRREAIDWIGKVHAHYNFGPLSAYLSINYLDRFLSIYELPKGKAWMTQLLSVACLSLAAKMEETVVPPPLDLQVGEVKYVFEAKTIQRMELLVLNTLNWKMRAVTPFSFTGYYLHKFIDGTSPTRGSFSRSVDLILNTIQRIDFLEFRPSEVAAAVALSVAGETQTVDASKALASCILIDQDKALKCYEIIKDMALISRPFKSYSGSASTVPQSPIGVLDNACLSYRSDDTIVGSQESSQDCSPDAKKRKINRE